MNNLEIEEKLVGYPVRVVCSDLLPVKIDKRPYTFVVNTDTCTGSGTHWVAFHFPVSGASEFFDSLGKKPETYHRRFQNVLIANGPNYLYSKSQIQPDESNTCGLYCIYFTRQRYRDKTFKEILQGFVLDRLQDNDLKVIKGI